MRGAAGSAVLAALALSSLAVPARAFALDCTEDSVVALATPEAFADEASISRSMAALSDHFHACRDGRFYFNKLYEMTTAAVDRASFGDGFEDPAWVRSLLVHYSNLYRNALVAPAAPWAHSRDWIAGHEDAHPPLLVAVSLSSHLSFDMPQALERTVDSPKELRAHRRDYRKINEALFSTTTEAFAVIEDRFGAEEPIRFQSFKSQLAKLWVRMKRRAAWRDGMRLERHGPTPERIERLGRKVIRQTKRLEAIAPIVR
jgi:hypothetical protein